MPGVLDLSGRLDVGALRFALSEIVRRHEALRTLSDRDRGRADATCLRRRCPRHLSHCRLSTCGHAATVTARRTSGRRRGAHPVRSGAGPRLRVICCGCAEGDHDLLLTLHHIVVDGWSLGILIRELAAALQGLPRSGRPSPLPELAIQYADFALWQRGWLSGEVTRTPARVLAAATGGSAANAFDLPARPAAPRAAELPRRCAAVSYRAAARRGDQGAEPAVRGRRCS